jgi:uncharacterized protein (DUF427 family)
VPIPTFPRYDPRRCTAARDGQPGTDEETRMKAVVGPHVIAESADAVEVDGYWYFPESAVRAGRLAKAARTGDDKQCPHGVQFYDVTVAGKRHPRAAWRYEAPRAAMARVAGRFAFWQDVKVTA